jgi:hypothetical protein
MSIGDYAFIGATALETIQIPAEVQVIRQGAFQNATALQTIRISAGVREIGDRAFANTQALREITFEQDSEISNIGYDAFRGSGLTLVSIGETALNRLNADAISRNALAAVNPSPFRRLPQLRFGENKNFYGKYNVKIVSRTQQINTLQLSTKKRGYKTPPKTGFARSLAETLRLKKPTPKTRPALPEELTREIGTYLMPKGIEPKSPAALAARAAAMEEESEEESEEEAAGGARKSRTRKRGIRRSRRKASTTRKTKKRKPKRRRSMKRK